MYCSIWFYIIRLYYHRNFNTDDYIQLNGGTWCYYAVPKIRFWYYDNMDVCSISAQLDVMLSVHHYMLIFEFLCGDTMNMDK